MLGRNCLEVALRKPSNIFQDATVLSFVSPWYLDKICARVTTIMLSDVNVFANSMKTKLAKLADMGCLPKLFQDVTFGGRSL